MAESKKNELLESNLSLWNQVGVTDVKHTKAVSLGGRKFTAIDAHSQILEATKIFGMYGVGWGVRNPRFWDIDVTGTGAKMLAYSAELFYRYDGKEGAMPIEASIFSVSQKGRPDEDCVKKVATDALTKGLSKLGFNADVFLGKFDDNKYVSKLKEDADMAESASKKESLIAELNAATNVDKVTSIWKSNVPLQKDADFIFAVKSNGHRLKPKEPETKQDEQAKG